jgi:hypothetical protein
MSLFAHRTVKRVMVQLMRFWWWSVVMLPALSFGLQVMIQQLADGMRTTGSFLTSTLTHMMPMLRCRGGMPAFAAITAHIL